MRIGVFTVLFQKLPFEAALDKIAAVGATAVEIGAGGYCGTHHCPVDDLLESAEKRKAYLSAIHSRGLILSGLNSTWEPLHPDKKLARASAEAFQKSVRLAQLLEVPVVMALSSCPAGAAGDASPNWITCPWPPHYSEMLKYQWEEVGIPYWRSAAQYAEAHGIQIGMEMHPGMLVYNVETLLRMREACGPALGCNLDPSHLFWNGVDIPTAIRKLGDAIVHCHGKDSYVDQLNIAANGCNDGKPYGEIARRAWTFRSIGYGHDAKTWKDIISALRLVGYDYVISIEHEDAMMSIDEGLAKGVALLKDVIMREQPGEMFWA
jgi:sugar phosphate isomerase/epimerase